MISSTYRGISEGSSKEDKVLLACLPKPYL